jgi:hypothetical protein
VAISKSPNTKTPTTRPRRVDTVSEDARDGKRMRAGAAMPHRCLAQESFFDARFAAPDCLVEGTLEWLLAERRDQLMPSWLFAGWSGEGRRGRDAWPAPVLMTMLVLRHGHGPMSLVETERRAKCDLTWRAAMGLALDKPTPSERTLRRFQRFLQTRHPELGERRYVLLHEHWARLCLEDLDVGVGSNWVADSTPMWCFGATRGTVRLLGDGLRALVQRWSRWTKTTLEQSAREWSVPFVLAKSTKGAFHIDWKDADARHEVVDELARAVLRVAKEIRSRLNEVPRASFRKKLLQRSRHLLKVVADDLEQDDHGRWIIARRTTPGRLVSVTDPQARHSRKSKSVCFKGFKLHLLGEVDSGLIASIAVTPANMHDGKVAPRLVRRATRLGSELDRLMGDTAYGSASLRHHLRVVHDVDLLAPPPPATNVSKSFRKDQFDIDFEREVARCPAGIESSSPARHWSKRHRAHYPVFQWPKATCDACPLTAQCRTGTTSTQARRLALHPFESEVREGHAKWSDPKVRQAYRTRSQGERLIREATRRGGRRAAAWGLQSAHRDVHLIAAANNLALLARAEARRRRTVDRVA